MAKCTRCGVALPADARFCPDCGLAIADADDPFAPIVAPAGQPATPAGAHRARSGSGWGWAILPIMIIVALAVIGVQLWSQRDAARPIAERKVETAARDESGTAPQAADKTAPPPEAADTGPPAAQDEAAEGVSAQQRSASDGELRASALDAAFTDDPQAARARYPGTVTVTGIVASLSPGASPSLSLEGRTRFNFVVATFSAGASDAISTLSKGSAVTLSCGRVATLAGTTMLRDCALR